MIGYGLLLVGGSVFFLRVPREEPWEFASSAAARSHRTTRRVRGGECLAGSHTKGCGITEEGIQSRERRSRRGKRPCGFGRGGEVNYIKPLDKFGCLEYQRAWCARSIIVTNITPTTVRVRRKPLVSKSLCFADAFQ